MPTTIYDSSLVTQRNRDKVIAQRIKQDTTNGKPIIVPQAGYNSYMIGEVDNGNISYFRKADGCTNVNLSCNCTGTTTVTTNGPAPAPAPSPAPSGTYTLRYRNTVSGGTEPAPITSYSGGTSISILGNTGPFTNTNNPTYQFGGWNTASDGTGTFYDVNDTLTMPYANTTLWAQWYNPAGTNYQVIYNGNGSTSGIAPATANYKQFQGVNSIAGEGSLVNGSLTFYGWNTAPNGLGIAYPVTSNGFTMPAANVTLYAQWVNTSNTFTLTYDGMGNTGGSVPAAPTEYPSNASVSVLGRSSLVKSGFTFLGWSTETLGAPYLANNTVIMNANKTLYAQWVGSDSIPPKSCSGINKPSGSPVGAVTISSSTNVYRDNTNNTITIIISGYAGNSEAGPFNTGLGPTDSTGNGNLLSTYAIAVLSKVGADYQINTTNITKWTGQTVVQTSQIIMSPIYWPTTENISQVTIPGPATLTPSAFTFDAAASPGPNFPLSAGGCTGGIQQNNAAKTFNQIGAFYITFNNGTTTRVAVGNEFRWTLQGTTNWTQPYNYINNYARVEVANGTTPSPTIEGSFTPISSTGANTV